MSLCYFAFSSLYYTGTLPYDSIMMLLVYDRIIQLYDSIVRLLYYSFYTTRTKNNPYGQTRLSQSAAEWQVPEI